MSEIDLIIYKLKREETRLQAIVDAEGTRTANGAKASAMLQGVLTARAALASAMWHAERVA